MTMNDLGALSIGLQLDFAGFEDQFKRLEQYKFKPFKVAIELDDRRFRQQLGSLSELSVGLKLDSDGFDRQFRQFRTQYGNGFDIPIHFKLNRNAVRQQLRNLQSELSGIEIPVTVRYANTAAPQLPTLTQDVQLRYRNGTGSPALNPLRQAVEFDTSKLEKELTNSVERAFKQVKGGGIGSTLTGLITAPLRAIGGISSNIASGLVLGATQEIGKNFGRGISEGIEKELAPIIGSSKLIGREMAGALTRELLVSLQSESTTVQKVIEELVGKKKIVNEAAAGRYQQSKEREVTRRQASQQVQKELEFVQENLPQIRERGKALQERRQTLEGKQANLQGQIEETAKSLGVEPIRQRRATVEAERDARRESLIKASAQQLKANGFVRRGKESLQAINNEIANIQGSNERNTPENQKRLAQLQQRKTNLEASIPNLEKREVKASQTVSQLSREIERLSNTFTSLDRAVESVEREAAQRYRQLSDKLSSELEKLQAQEISFSRVIAPLEEVDLVDQPTAPIKGKGSKAAKAASTKGSVESQTASQLYKGIFDEVTSRSGVQVASENIPRLVVSSELPKGVTGQYVSANNQIQLSPEAMAKLAKGEVDPKLTETLTHETRHAVQSDFGRLAGQNESAVPLIKPTFQEARKFGANVESSVAGGGSAYSKDFLRATESDAYAFADRNGAEIYEKVARTQAIGKLESGVGVGGSKLEAQVKQAQKALFAKLIELKNAGDLDLSEVQEAVGLLEQSADISPILAKLKDVEILPVEQIAALQQELEASVTQTIAQMQQQFQEMEQAIAERKQAIAAGLTSQASTQVQPQAKPATLSESVAQPEPIEVKAVAPDQVPTPVELPKPVTPKTESKAKPAEAIAEEPQGKPLQDYTRPQLLAAARKLGFEGVSTKTNKDELISRIARTGRDKFGPVLDQVEATIGRDGSILGGADTAKEKALLKKVAAAEKKINSDLEKLLTLEGRKRQALLVKVAENINSLNVEIVRAKREPLSGETIQAISGTQGRLRNIAQNNPAFQASRNESQQAVQATAQGAQAARVRGLARVSPDGLVAVDREVAELQQPIQDIFKGIRASLKKAANFAAKQFDVEPQPTIKGTLGAIARSEKGRAQIADLAVNTAGFAASKLGAQFGVVPELAGDIGGALIARQAINVGTAGFSAYKSLKEDPTFQQAKRLQKLRLLAGQTNLNMLSRQRETGAELTGDVAGFAIGNLAANAGDALGIGIPLKGALAAMAITPKVVAARERALDRSQPEGLARVADTPQGLFSNLSEKFRSLLPSNQKRSERLKANYQRIFEEISNVSGVAFDPAQVPKLEIGGDRLKKLGAQAYYDIEQNLILVDKELGRILGKKTEDLSKFQQQLAVLVHEGRHSLQLQGGSLGLDAAAAGKGVRLLAGDNLNFKQRRSVDASVEVARRQGAAIGELPAVRALETDAYAFEGNTSAILESISGKNGQSLIRKFREQLAKAFKRPEKALSPAAQSLEADFELEELQQSGVSVQELRRQNRSQRRAARNQAKFDDAVQRAEVAQQGVRDNLGKFDDAERAIGNLEEKNLSGASAREGVKQTSETVDRFQRVLKAAGIPVDKFNFSLQGLGKYALSAAAGFIGFQVLNQVLPVVQRFGTEALQAAIKLDNLKTALNFASGGSAQGAQSLDFVRKEADRLGISLDAAQQGYVKLKAATRGSRSEGAANSLFSGIGATATVLGLTKDETAGVSLAFSQIASKGKVYAEELLQIQERVPGFAAVAQRALSLTGAEMSKALEQGLVSADEFLPKIARQLQIEFGGAARAASDNVQSSLYRLDNAFQRLQESLGSAFAPTVSAGAKLLAQGLDLAAQNADKLLQVMLVVAGILAAQFLPSLAQIPAIAGLIGPLFAGGIVPAIQSAAVAMAGFLAKFVLIQLAIETAKGLFDAFVPTEIGQQFKDFGDQAVANLNRIQDAAKAARGEVKGIGDDTSNERPSAGVDVGGALTLGAFSFKTDDFVKLLNGANAKVNPLLGLPKDFGNLRTVADYKAEQTFGKQDQLATANGQLAQQALTGRIDDDKGGSIGVLGSLKQTAELDKQIAALQNQRTVATSVAKPDKAKIQQLDEQIKSLQNQKESAAAPVTELRGAIQAAIDNNKKALNGGIDADKSLSAEDKKKLKAQVEVDLKQLQQADEQLNKFESQIKTSVSAARELSAAFSEIAAKLDQARRDAERSFNQKGTNILKDQLKTLQNDPLASSKAQVKQSEAERDKLQTQVTSGQQAIDGQRRQLESDATKAILAGVPIGTTGKTVNIDSSIKEIEEAKKGLSAQDKEGQKGQILDRLKEFKEAQDKQPELEKQLAQADLGVVNAKQQAELTRLDRDAEIASSKTKRGENFNLAQIAKKQALGQIDESQAGVETAQAQLNSTGQSIGDLENRLSALQAAKEKGLVTAEEFDKRERQLMNERSDLQTRQAQQQLSLQQAQNRKILEGIELANKKANFAIQQSRGLQAIAVKKQILGGKLDEEDAQPKQTAIEQSASQKERAQIEKELAQVKQLRAQKVLSAKEATEKELDLKSRLQSTDEKLVDLQIQKRRQLQEIIEKNFQREQQRIELAKTLSIVEVKQGRMRGVDQADVDRQITDLEIKGSEGTLDLLNRKLATVRGQRAKGELGPKEAADKEREIQQQLANEKLKLVDLEIQKQQQLRDAIDKTFQRQQAQLELLQLQQQNQIRGRFVDQFVSGQPINLKLEEINTEGQSLRAQQSGLSERRALLDRQLADERTYAGLGAKERLDKAQELQKELAGIDGEVIANRKAIEENDRARFNQIVDQRVRQSERIIEREQKLADIYNKSLEINRKLVEARGQLAQSANQLAQTQTQAGIDSINRALDIKRKAETEQDPEKAYQYDRVAQQLGLNSGQFDEDKLLLKKFQLEEKLANLKQQAMLQELDMKKALLEIDLKRDRLAAEQALRESRKAKIQAQGELDKAIRSGDTQAIAEARQKLFLSGEDVLANEQAIQSQDELAGYARANLAAQQQTAIAQFKVEQQGRVQGQVGEVIDAIGQGTIDDSALTRLLTRLQPLQLGASGEVQFAPLVPQAPIPANNIAPFGASPGSAGLLGGGENIGDFLKSILKKFDTYLNAIATGVISLAGLRLDENSLYSGLSTQLADQAQQKVLGADGSLPAQENLPKLKVTYYDQGKPLSEEESAARQAQLALQARSMNQAALTGLKTPEVPDLMNPAEPQGLTGYMSEMTTMLAQKLDLLNANIERLANTPRQLHFETKDPIADYAGWVNQQAGAMMGST